MRIEFIFVRMKINSMRRGFEVSKHKSHRTFPALLFRLCCNQIGLYLIQQQ